MHLRESDLLLPVRSFLEARGYAVRSEVPVGGRRADLVGVSGTIAAVELKLKNCPGALRQSMAYQLGADFVWVAMPFASAAESLRYRDRFEQEGVGLLAVIREECRELIEARPSPRLLPPLGEAARAAWTLAGWFRPIEASDGETEATLADGSGVSLSPA